MKLIIDIPEEDFNLIRDNIKSYSLADTVFGAVKDGIPYEDRPQVDLVSPAINVNITEETKQKLIEELQKPHKLLVLPEPEVAFERPQGEWIIVDDTEQFIAKCSVCGRIEDSRMVKDYPFCHCGADMREK